MEQHIRILPPELASQIAAGEVVERPASAVKELLDNAIDAGAKTIRIDVEKGGTRRVLVVDDGTGMDREDAILCVERHSTSKIRTLEDLSAITTLGFRGEALASIASVSHLSLTTRTAESVSGWRVTVEGGRDKQVEEIGAPIGTSVLVEDLFYNVPARRKFLKAETTELRHITDVATRHALGHEDVHYVLRHNNRSVFDLQGVPDRLERIAALLGKEVAGNFAALFGETATTSVEGFVSRPTYYRKSADQIYFILNGRWIQNRSLMAALLSGYEKCLPPRHYPAAVLYLTVNPHDVDVNVHPSKIEVKFADEGRIFSLVRSAVQAALSDRPQSTDMECGGLPPLSKAQASLRTSEKPEAKGARDTVTASQTTFLSRPPTAQSPDYRERVKEKVAEFLGSRKPQRDYAATGRTLPSKPPGEKQPLKEGPTGPVGPTTEATSRLPSDLKALGQVLDTYVLCRSSEGLIIVDVHAAHERIRYENLLAEAARSKPTSEHLLFPARVELSPADVDALLEHRDILAGIGFEIEDFGGGSLSVSRLPVVVGLGAIEAILRDLAVDLREYGSTDSWEDLLERTLIRISCHSALRSGKSLRPDEMEALIDQLRSTPRGDTCPHGRPTWVRLKKDDLERIFKRSGF